MLTEENLINHDLNNIENSQKQIISTNKNDQILQSFIENLTEDLERAILLKKAFVLSESDDSTDKSTYKNDLARLKRSQPLSGNFFFLLLHSYLPIFLHIGVSF